MTPEIWDIFKILWERGEIFPLFHNILLPLVRFPCWKQGPDFNFEINSFCFELSVVVITSVDYMRENGSNATGNGEVPDSLSLIRASDRHYILQYLWLFKREKKDTEYLGWSVLLFFAYIWGLFSSMFRQGLNTKYANCLGWTKHDTGERICSQHVPEDLIYEPEHDKTYNETCATSEDSDQPAHPRSLIRVFADRMCLLQALGYPKRDKWEPLPYWMDVQADLSLLITQVLL